MTSRRCIPGVLLAAAMIAPASAAPPSPITHLADASSLSQPQRQEILDYAGYWCQQLMADDPATVDEAREGLTDPLLRPVEVTQVFRLAYTDAVLPHLDDVIQNAGPQAAVSAMQIAGMLGTPRALEMIVQHASIQDESRFNLRLWSAKSFPLAVREGVLPVNEVDRALRRFGDAASREENWLVLRRQFEAIASVSGNVSRDEQVRALRAATDRMDGNKGPSDLMQAVNPAVNLMLKEYLSLQPAQQEAFGKSLAPVLCDLVSVANKHWDSAQQDEAARVNYGGAINISENLLRLIDRQIRPRQAGPRTELGPAWTNRQKRRFHDDHEAWRAVVSRPPYSDGRH